MGKRWMRVMGYCENVNQERTVAAAILDILAAHRIEVAFGIPGVHNLAFWNALSANRPKIVGVRHEQTSVYAADGNFRVTGNLGVAITTTGPGAANTLGAFGEASVSNSAVLVISSEAPIALRKSDIARGLLHEMNDQSALFAPLAKKVDGKPLAISVNDAKSAISAAAYLVNKLQEAPRGCGYLGIPADVLNQLAPDEILSESREPVHENLAQLAEVTNLIEKSERVAIWAGGGALDYSEEVGALAERLGAPIFTSFAGRGVGAASKNYLTAPVHEPEISELLAESELLLVFGSELDGMNTKNWSLPFPKEVVIIDPAPDKPAINASSKRYLATADFKSVISKLQKVEVKSNWRDYAQICSTTKERLQSSAIEKAGITFVRVIDENWSQANPIFCDMAISGYWVGVYGLNQRPRRSAYPVGWGTLGFALPAAIGGATKSATLVVCGDGGLAFALSELATIQQEKLPITILLNDDGGYGMLRYDQQVMKHPERGVDLFNPNWELIAESFNFSFQEVSLDTLGSALRKSEQSGKPSLIIFREKLNPPRSTSPRWREIN